MQISIGSKNPAKIGAVEEYFIKICKLENVQVSSLAIDSGVSKQPMTLEETITGAMNRSTRAYNNVFTISIGIEGGIMPVKEALSGYMNVCAVSIFDGNSNFIGLSSAFEHPISVIDLILNKNEEVSNAYQLAGLYESNNIGKGIGAIGFMTNGQIDRKEYCIQALTTAYGSYVNRKLLGKI
jgi:inosine/xanthosine triphosphatase